MFKAVGLLPGARAGAGPGAGARFGIKFALTQIVAYSYKERYIEVKTMSVYVCVCAFVSLCCLS